MSNSSSSKTVQQSIQQQQQSKPKEKYQTLINNNDSFDLFLADSFEFYLKENISDVKFKKIKQAALMMWGLDITECIMSDFGKMQFTMQCVLGEKTANKQSKNITKKLFSVVNNNNNSKHETITLHHKSLTEKVLFSYGNQQKKAILDLLQDQSVLLSDILRHVKLARNVCNIHLKDLIADGLIVRCNDITTTTSKNSNNNTNYYKKDKDMNRYYTCMFSNIAMNFVHSKISIQAIVKKDFYKSSVLYTINPSTRNYGKIQREYDIKDMEKNYTKYRKNQDKGKKS